MPQRIETVQKSRGGAIKHWCFLEDGDSIIFLQIYLYIISFSTLFHPTKKNLDYSPT